MSYAVELVNLKKSYGDNDVLKGVGLVVSQGQVVSILGPNGAGKTTTLEIIEGQRRPDSGQVRTLGFDPSTRSGFQQLRQRIGVALQSSSFEPKLSVRDMVTRQESYYNTTIAIEPLVESLALGEFWNRRVGNLSEGIRQRLNVLLALVGNPELVLLDEPTAGLDPVSRVAVMQLIEALAEHGMTVLLSSHLLEEVETLANEVVVLRDGRVRASGSPRAVLESVALPTHIEFRAVGDTGTLPAGASVTGELVRYAVLDPDRLLSEIQIWEKEYHNRVTQLSVMRPTLNDAYIELIGGSPSK